MDDSNVPEDPAPVPPPTHHGASPVVAFIIGLSIIILASILNAAGLNLTKLDHVCLHLKYSITLLNQSIYRSGLKLYPRPREKRTGSDLYGF